MTRRLIALAPAALVAATMLLSACGQVSPATQTNRTTPVASTSSTPSSTPTQTRPQNPPEPPKSTSGTPSGGGDKIEAVDCGPVKVDGGATHTLIADPTPGGRVGCTEAFNVIDEYLHIPVSKRNANGLQNTKVSGGWECGIDDGEHAVIGCLTTREAKDKVGDFAFHTEVLSK